MTNNQKPFAVVTKDNIEEITRALNENGGRILAIKSGQDGGKISLFSHPLINCKGTLAFYLATSITRKREGLVPWKTNQKDNRNYVLKPASESSSTSHSQKILLAEGKYEFLIEAQPEDGIRLLFQECFILYIRKGKRMRRAISFALRQMIKQMPEKEKNELMRDFGKILNRVMSDLGDRRALRDSTLAGNNIDCILGAVHRQS